MEMQVCLTVDSDELIRLRDFGYLSEEEFEDKDAITNALHSVISDLRKTEKSLQYPSMPFDIDDVVYYMEKASEISGHSGYKIIKTKCAGYWNLGDGWEIAFKNKGRTLIDLTKMKSLPISSAGYTIFGSKEECMSRIREINGRVVWL